MAEGLFVTLGAEDLVSGPTEKAIQSLEKFQSTVGSLSATGDKSAAAAKAAASGMAESGKAAAEAVVPHSAAHQAMRLVTEQMGEMAGVAGSSSGAMRVLESVLFQVSVAGKAISPVFLAVTAVAVGAATAFKAFGEDAKKAKEEVADLQKKNQEAVLGMNFLGDTARGVAAQGAAEMARNIVDLKDKLGDAEVKMRELQERAMKLSSIDTTRFTSEGGMEPTPQTTSDVGPIQAQVDASRKAVVNLRMELEHAEKQYDNLTKASKGQGESSRASGKLIQAATAEAQQSLNSYIRELERAGQTAQLFADFSIDGMERVKQVAEQTGASWAEMVDVAKKQTQILHDFVQEGALMMGQALGNVIAGNKDAWRNGLRSLVGFFFDAATQIVLASALVNKAISAMLIPFGFGAILGIAVGLQAIKAVAMSALGGAAAGAGAAGSATVASLGGGAASTAASGKSTTGGQALATAQREVTNNISISLPVQALDLAAVSDIQLKGWASRIGRAIREAAATGQFSTSAA